MITESDIEASIDIQLNNLGWQPDYRKKGRNVFKQNPRTEEEKNKLNGLRPDYTLYSDEASNRPSIVIEAKKPNSSLLGALEQAKKYARILESPIAIATDGYRIKTWHLVKEQPLYLNDALIEGLFSKEVSIKFIQDNSYCSFKKIENISKKELIKKFEKANEILRSEGLDAGIVRFSEFANLMFLKLLFETQSGLSIAGHTWDSLENDLTGQKLLGAIKSIFTAIKKDYNNKNIFKDINIKNPRNIERLVNVLSSFKLSSVNEDIKGVAFEYFIHSYTQGLHNDLGQYFTPRHIIKVMVDYLKPEIGETIYDPFCGTGGMLIECFRYLVNKVQKEKEREILKNDTLFGRDNSSVSRIAMMNMIMFGDGHSNIERGDTFAQRVSKKYDIVITNIPFSQKTDYTEGYPVAPKGNKNGDSIAVQYCLSSLCQKNTARAGIIVPIGFIYKKDLQEEREYILRNFLLEEVIELTPKCFNPYTEQQTAILLLKRGKTKKISYFYVENDGFSQDGYRTPLLGENDIDKVMEGKGAIEHFIDDKNREFKKLKIICKKNETPLGDIASIRKGDSISPKTQKEYTISAKRPILMVADLSKRHIDPYLYESKFFINEKAIKEKSPFLFPKHATIIATSGKATLLNHRGLLANNIFLTSTLTGVMSKDKNKLHPFCIYFFFLKYDVEKVIYDLGYPGLSTNIMRKIPFPIYSDKEQESIVSQVTEMLEGCKKMKSIYEDILGS